MDVTSSKRGEAVVYRIGGRMAVEGLAELERDLLATIDAGNRTIVFDLSELEYISSAGLRVLVVVMKRLGDGKLTLAAPRPSVQQVLDIANLSKALRIVPSVDEALTS